MVRGVVGHRVRRTADLLGKDRLLIGGVGDVATTRCLRIREGGGNARAAGDLGVPRIVPPGLVAGCDRHEECCEIDAREHLMTIRLRILDPRSRWVLDDQGDVQPLVVPP